MKTFDAKTQIGYITDVRTGELIASLSDMEQRVQQIVTVGGEDIPVGKVGSYVAVVQSDECCICIVSRMRESEKLITPSINSSDIRRAGTPKAERALVLIPVGSIDSKGTFLRGIRFLPTTGAEVHVVSNRTIKSMFNVFVDKGYDIGCLSSSPAQRIFLDPSPLFGRHFAILGQTGAGKSHTVARLLQRTVEVMPRAHVVLLDLHGEYSWIDEQGVRKTAFDNHTARHIDARNLEIPYWLMSFAELCDLLVDHSEREAANQIAFFRDTLFQLKEQEKTNVGLERISVDTPIYFSLDNLLTIINTENTRKVPGARGEKSGPLHGQFDRFLIRLNSKLNDIRYDFLLKPKKRKTSADLSGLLRDFVGLGGEKSQITIIDLSSVPFDVRPTVAAQIGRLAFEFNYWNPAYKKFPLLLVCEEAHAYIPREFSGQYAGARKSMERIAKEGRKYGVGLGIVSQRPHEISETVLAQCGSFVCLRTTNPTDQSYIKNLVPEAERDLVDVMSGLSRGEAMILGEAVPLPSRIQFDKPNPEPNSDDVDFYTQWREGPEDINVDDIVDRWRRQNRNE